MATLLLPVVSVAWGHSMIPTLVLNLARDIKRREWMSGHLGSLGISHQFIDAVNGFEMHEECMRDDVDRFRRHHGRSITLGELGCARSHLKIARMIADGPDPFVCVLEDDIELRLETVGFLDEHLLTNLPRFDLFRLYSLPWRQKRPAWQRATVNGHTIVAPLKSSYGTQAQIYSREGARKVGGLSITAPIDCMIYTEALIGLRIFEVRPSLVNHLTSDFESTIPDSARDPAIHTFWSKVYRPLLPRIHFLRTWGLPGLMGLIRYRFPQRDEA